MKSQLLHTIRGLLLFVFFSASANAIQAQGRIVINEYMPWPGSSCGTTAEFIELLNFGPGPVNIGCYILTDGDYAITIPANTVLQPGQFYVIAGVDSIAGPCANLDSTIRVHLNWNKCGCTSAPIPTTGDGFLTDGGSANEQVVLLDPQLNVVDAVARSLPVEFNNTITTLSPAGSSCSSVTFNLNLLNTNYETIGESAGRGNSFARSTDGDCGWVKDPQQSAGATNNRGGEVPVIQYTFYYVKASTCNRDGKVVVTVNAPDYAVVFPMTYILAFDANKNGQFDTNDQYTNGVVNTPNTITIDSLQPGNYRLTVASAKGCYLKTFPFNISGCAIATLPLKLLSFQAQRQGEDVLFGWSIEEAELLEQVVLEGSTDGHSFQPLHTILVPAGIASLWNNRIELAVPASIRFVRLRMISRQQEHSWSQTIKLGSNGTVDLGRVYPNPTQGAAQLETEFKSDGTAEVRILNPTGQLLRQFRQPVQTGLNRLPIDLSNLPAGIYLIQCSGPNPSEIKSFRISKR